jgi:hypothetical protein
VDWTFYGEPRTYRASLFDLIVIIEIMRVLVVELDQAVMI